MGAFSPEMARERLRDGLADLRGCEGFPHADADAMLRVSMPPLYTACPNPFIGEFLAPVAGGGDYSREPFAADISEGRSDLIYRGQVYHTKVPPRAIARYIDHFTPPGGVVFDGFCGSGMTGVAAQMTGRRAVLVDLSPAATAIAVSYCAPPEAEEASRALDEVLRKMDEECGWLYRLEDGRELDHVLWSEVYECPVCGCQAPFSDLGFDFETRQPLSVVECAGCREQMSARRLSRCTDEAGTIVEVPARVKYVGAKTYEAPSEPDLALLSKIDGASIPHWYPDGWMMHREPDGDGWGDMWRRGYHQGVNRVSDFYTRRTLWCIASALAFARELDASPRARHFVEHTIINASINLTKMRRAFQGPVPLVLYLPRLRRECNVMAILRRRFSRALRVLDELPRSDDVIISTQSSTRMPNIPDGCIDYIFTDPPFGQNIIYSEVNFLWESWMGITTAQQSEAIISKRQQKGIEQYRDLMRQCFAESKRILKPGRWMTVEFHNSQNEIWAAIQEALRDAGFVVEDVRILRKEQPSFKQASTENAVDQDLVISAHKPVARSSVRRRSEHKEEDVWRFVTARLESLGDAGGKTAADRTDRALYSRMVQHFISKGWRVPIDAHTFYAELPRRFVLRKGRYYLKQAELPSQPGPASPEQDHNPS